MDESVTPVFSAPAIAPHLHGSTGDTKGVIFPTSQFYFRVAGWSGGGCSAEGRLRGPGFGILATQKVSLINKWKSPRSVEEHLYC